MKVFQRGVHRELMESAADPRPLSSRRWGSRVGLQLRVWIHFGIDRLIRAIAQACRSSQAPRIATVRDRQGHLYFLVYDPIAHTQHRFNSETEVRVWLEQRYYL